MEIKSYNYLPTEAMKIRTEVFVKEQGFIDLPDEIDDFAIHFVGYLDSLSVATCRVFADAEGEYVLGRFAVVREQRGKRLGSELLDAVCKTLSGMGAPFLKLHSQYSAKDFYEKNGFLEFAEPEYEQNALHVWMIKDLSSYK